MQRNPLHAFPRSNLAHMLRGAGRYAEARQVAERAMAENLQTMPMRRLLYQLGELQGDRTLAQQQIEWAAGQTRNFDISGARGQVAIFHGRVAEARRLFGETMAAATERGFPQVASGYAAQAAFAEVLYGYGRAPLEQARTVVRSATAFEPQLRAATAMALGGEPAEADALAHLGLGRAYARTGAIAESRAAYEALLTIWAGADPDLPILRQAREEFAALTSKP